MIEDFKHNCNKCVNYGCAFKMAGIISDNSVTTCYGYYPDDKEKESVSEGVQDEH